MDNLINRPLGLAALITATISLLAQPAVEHNAHQAVLQPQAQPALKGGLPGQQNLQALPEQPTSQAIPQADSQQTAPTQELSEEELRTARLMLSIESLFKSTTAN